MTMHLANDHTVIKKKENSEKKTGSVDTFPLNSFRGYPHCSFEANIDFSSTQEGTDCQGSSCSSRQCPLRSTQDFEVDQWDLWGQTDHIVYFHVWW